MHRLWLFQFALHAKFESGTKRGIDWDLDSLFNVPAVLTGFDESTDQEVLHSKLLQFSGMAGGVATAVDAAVAPAVIDPQTRYAAWDQFEQQSGRRVTPAVLLTMFAWTRDLTSSRKRKLLWDLFQAKGRMYPGRLLDLGSQTAKAFGIPFGEAEAKAVASLMKHMPRRHHPYMRWTEWVAWCKLYSLRHDEEDETGAYGLLFNCFGLVTHILKSVRRAVEHNTDTSHREFAGKVRVDHEILSSLCRIENGFMTLTSPKGKRVIDLVHSVALSDGRRHVTFKPAFGENLRLKVKSMRARNQLVAAIKSYASVAADYSKNRFESFHPQDKTPITANFFIDGAPYYNALLDSLNEAQSEILISDWSLSPEVYLLRGHDGGPHTRLDVVLKKKAAEGVKVNILLWWEIFVAVGGAVNSQHVKDVFKDDKNITVFAHPVNNIVWKWSHHQKFVVIDRAVAYVGGIDLCFGRYDTQQHTLTDENHLAMTFPGKDFYNPNVTPCNDLDKPYQENLDRTKQCRMPWHDVQVQLTGVAAAYVARNFVERWNKTLSDMNLASPTIEFDKAPSPLGSKVTGYPIQAQVLRSLAEWSGTNATKEQSIFNAYAYLIKNSEHFIYVENQFFVSSVDVVQNQIAHLMVDRISKSIESGDTFRVIVVVPLHPEGPYNTPMPRIVSLWMYRTTQAMIEYFKKTCPGRRLEDFVSIYCPMQNTMLQDKSYLNMIYVHSKLIIADDRMAIVGSANINDRSMMGDRDSELAVILESCDDHTITMAGLPGYKCSKMLTAWRTSLWREHLGFNFTTDEQMSDPLDACKLFSAHAAINLALVEPVIRIDPHRLWHAVSTGLPDHVGDAYIARSVRQWIQEKKIAVGADLCRCCEQNRIGTAECARCEEPLCKSCCLSEDAVAPMVARHDERQGRRGAVPTEALQASIALGMSQSEKPVLCHSCCGRECDVVSLGAVPEGSSEDVDAPDARLASADFKIKSMLKRLNMQYDDEAVAVFLRKCLQDRTLAASLLSTETAQRLRAIRGFVFPYPVDICPRLKPDLMAMAPKDIFT